MEYWRDHRHTTRTERWKCKKQPPQQAPKTNHGGTRAAKILPEDKIIMIDENHQIGMDDEEMDLGGDGADDAE
jgi:hypothetical protein